MKRILLINYAVGAPSHGGIYRSHILAEHWVKQGIEVRFLAASYSHLMQSPPEPTSEERSEQVNGVDYRLLPVKPYRSTIQRTKALYSIWKTGAEAIKRHAAEFKPDLILAGTVYQLENEAVTEAARAVGAVSVRETRDLWPMTIKEFSRTWPINPFVPIIQQAEDHACREMDLVVSTLPRAFDHFSTRGLTQDRFLFSPQIAPPPEWSQDLPSDIEDGLKRLRDQVDVLFVFAGGFVPSNGVDSTMKAVAEAGGKVGLAVLGAGALEPDLRELAATLGPNIQMLGSVPRACLGNVLTYADGGLQWFHDKPIYRFGVSPNKVTEYLHYGVPCVITAPEGGSVVSLSGGGLSAPTGQFQPFVQAIAQFASLSAEERKAMGSAGKAYVEQNCTAETISANLLRAAEAKRR